MIIEQSTPEVFTPTKLVREASNEAPDYSITPASPGGLGSSQGGGGRGQLQRTQATQSHLHHLGVLAPLRVGVGEGSYRGPRLLNLTCIIWGSWLQPGWGWERAATEEPDYSITPASPGGHGSSQGGGGRGQLQRNQTTQSHLHHLGVMAPARVGVGEGSYRGTRLLNHTCITWES